MLIGGDDISNDVSTLGTCFLMFIHILASFRFALIGGSLTAESTGSHRGIGRIGGGSNSNSRDVVASSPSFSALPPERPAELVRRLRLKMLSSEIKHFHLHFYSPPAFICFSVFGTGDEALGRPRFDIITHKLLLPQTFFT